MSAQMMSPNTYPAGSKPDHQECASLQCQTIDGRANEIDPVISVNGSSIGSIRNDGLSQPNILDIRYLKGNTDPYETETHPRNDGEITVSPDLSFEGISTQGHIFHHGNLDFAANAIDMLKLFQHANDVVDIVDGPPRTVANDNTIVSSNAIVISAAPERVDSSPIVPETIAANSSAGGDTIQANDARDTKLTVNGIYRTTAAEIQESITTESLSSTDGKPAKSRNRRPRFRRRNTSHPNNVANGKDTAGDSDLTSTSASTTPEKHPKAPHHRQGTRKAKVDGTSNGESGESGDWGTGPSTSVSRNSRRNSRPRRTTKRPKAKSQNSAEIAPSPDAPVETSSQGCGETPGNTHSENTAPQTVHEEPVVEEPVTEELVDEPSIEESSMGAPVVEKSFDGRYTEGKPSSPAEALRVRIDYPSFQTTAILEFEPDLPLVQSSKVVPTPPVPKDDASETPKDEPENSVPASHDTPNVEQGATKPRRQSYRNKLSAVPKQETPKPLAEQGSRPALAVLFEQCGAVFSKDKRPYLQYPALQAAAQTRFPDLDEKLLRAEFRDAYKEDAAKEWPGREILTSSIDEYFVKKDEGEGETAKFRYDPTKEASGEFQRLAEEAKWITKPLHWDVNDWEASLKRFEEVWGDKKALKERVTFKHACFLEFDQVWFC
jgi:hypothetical protein